MVSQLSLRERDGRLSLSYGAKQLFLTQFTGINVYSFSSEFKDLDVNDVLALTVREISVVPGATELRAIYVATQPLPGIVGCVSGRVGGRVSDCM